MRIRSIGEIGLGQGVRYAAVRARHNSITLDSFVREKAMMTMPRINDPQPLVFIPDLRSGEADGKPLLLDLFAPRAMGGKPRPAMIWLHGYGWFAGTRRDNLEIAMATLLASAGVVTVSIEYRLSSEAAFPAQIHDVKAAIRWLRASTATYGIDPDHIDIAGASAGDGLSALAGLTGDLPELEGRSGSRATPAAYRQSRSRVHWPTSFGQAARCATKSTGR